LKERRKVIKSGEIEQGERDVEKVWQEIEEELIYITDRHERMGGGCVVKQEQKLWEEHEKREKEESGE
jgi:hypothetical protein